MGNVVSMIAGGREAPKAVQSKMRTEIITQKMVYAWKIPPFRRQLRVNDKVRALVEQIKATESIEGVLTLGRLKTETAVQYFIVDGQHRVEAFKLSEIDEAIADLRIITFDTMGDMAEEFVRLNSSLVKMRPDDILRGLEDSVPALRQIRSNCEFVGYDQVRRGGGSGAILSMSAVLRCWGSAQFETPSGNNSGLSAAATAQTIDQTSLQNLIVFLATAHAAWGRDPEYYRLWGNLNLALCMWLFNKIVMDRDCSGSKRYSILTINEFKKCLMSVSANNDYVEWLVGRNLGERDRNPCHTRLKQIFARRLNQESSGKKWLLPNPAWWSQTT